MLAHSTKILNIILELWKIIRFQKVFQFFPLLIRSRFFLFHCYPFKMLIDRSFSQSLMGFLSHIFGLRHSTYHIFKCPLLIFKFAYLCLQIQSFLLAAIHLSQEFPDLILVIIYLTFPCFKMIHIISLIKFVLQFLNLLSHSLLFSVYSLYIMEYAHSCKHCAEEDNANGMLLSCIRQFQLLSLALLLLIVVSRMHAGNNLCIVTDTDRVVEEFVLAKVLSGNMQVAMLHRKFRQFTMSISLSVYISKL